MLVTKTYAETGFKCILKMHKMCKQLSSKVHAPYPLLICLLRLIMRVMGPQLGELSDSVATSELPVVLPSSLEALLVQISFPTISIKPKGGEPNKMFISFTP